MAHFMMKSSAAAIALLAANAALATPPAGVPHGPPAGIPMGPPAGVPHGPPAGVPHGPPQGVPQGKPQGLPDSATSIGANVHASASAHAAAPHDPSLEKGASLLGKLNAAHASDTALAHASSKSVVGALATYKSSTLSAQADVSTYTEAVATDQANVAADQKAITDAQQALTEAQNANDQAAIDAANADLAAAQNQLATDQSQLSADQASLAAAQQAIVDAQTTLSSSTNKTLTPEVVAKLNALLGIS